MSYKPGIYQVTNKLNFHLNFHFKMGIVETYNPVITRVRQKELEVRDELRLQSSKLLLLLFLTKQSKFFILSLVALALNLKHYRADGMIARPKQVQQHLVFVSGFNLKFLLTIFYSYTSKMLSVEF